MEEESVADILRHYEGEGFSTQFSARAGPMVFCHECRDGSPAEQVQVHAMHRLEGISDPSEQQVVAALECPACGALGTMLLSYGPEASAEDGAVLAELMDSRDRSAISPGL